MVPLEGINSTKLSSFAQIGSRVPAELVILPHTAVTRKGCRQKKTKVHAAISKCLLGIR